MFGSNYLGDTLLTLPVCHSTNDKVASLVKEGGAKPGLLVRAVEQTNGKGQRGNVWESEAGKNLTFTAFLVPESILIQDQFLISKFVALALVQLLDSLGLEAVTVKWPNDIYIGEKKIGGILIENTAKGKCISSSIVGIGLNVNQAEFENLRATSLLKEAGKSFRLESLLQQFVDACQSLEKVITRNGVALLNRWYLERMFGYGKRRFYRRAVTGEEFVATIAGVSPVGHLLLKTEDGTVTSFDLKEVQFIFSE